MAVPTLGKADAGLVLLSFEDYKSAGAAQHATSIEPALKTKYVDTGQMRLVVKPLADTAPRAAVAAVCAARQGKFWEFRSLLYQKQAEWTEGDDAAMSGYAKSLGLDQAAFDACLKDATAQNEVDYATAFGQEIGVPTVPSFLVLKIGANGKAENSKGLPGAQTLEQIEQAIQELQAPPTPTPSSHRAGEAGQPPGGRGCGRELLSRGPERADQAGRFLGLPVTVLRPALCANGPASG